MKKIIAFGMSILFVVLSACQPQGTEIAESPTKTTAPTIIPSQTPSLVPTFTPTPMPLSYPLTGGTALPGDFSSQAITSDTASNLKEIFRVGQDDIVFFDVKYWNRYWLVETNQGVKLFNEKEEWLADFIGTQRRCPPENVNYVETGQPSNIYIGPGGIGVVSFDGVHIYSLDGSEEIKFIPLDESYINIMGTLTLCSSLFLASVSPDMKWVAVAQENASYSTVEVISVESGETIKSLPGASARIFSPDSQYLLVQSGEKNFVLYKTSDWSQMMLLRPQDDTHEFGFSSSGEYLGLLRNNAAVFFRHPNGNQSLTVQGAQTLMFNEKTNEIGVTWMDARNIHVWDFDTSHEIRVDPIDTDGWHSFVMDTHLIALSYRKGILNTIGFRVKDYSYRGTSEIICDFEQEGFSCFSADKACFYDLHGKKECKNIETQSSIKKTFGNITYDLYEKDGAFSGHYPPWYAERITWRMPIADDPSPGYMRSPDKKSLIYLPGYLWSIMSPDQKYFIYSTRDDRSFNTILHFVVNDQELSQREIGWLQSAKISSNSKYLLTVGYDRTMFLWDLETAKVVKSFSGFFPRGIAFSSDNRLIAYIQQRQGGIKLIILTGKLIIYNVVDDKELNAIDLNLAEGKVNTIAFSPDSSLAAVGTFDGTIYICDLKSDEVVHSWRAHVGVVSDIKFSPDGKWLLSAGGMDENVKLWAVK